MAQNRYKVGDSRDLGTCSACGNVIVIEAENDLFKPQRCVNPVKLADGTWLCGSCLRKLRVKFPQRYAAVVKPMTPPYETVSELTAEDARRELGSIHAFQEGLRERYGFRQAAFYVENVQTQKAGLLKPPYVTVTGHVIYGTFYPLDEVCIGPGGGQQYKICCLDYPHRNLPLDDLKIDRLTGKLVIDKAWADGGEEAAFVFRDKGLNLRPGDVLVKG